VLYAHVLRVYIYVCLYTIYKELYAYVLYVVMHCMFMYFMYIFFMYMDYFFTYYMHM
jgi:hypothetical protein